MRNIKDINSDNFRCIRTEIYYLFIINLLRTHRRSHNRARKERRIFLYYTLR